MFIACLTKPIDERYNNKCVFINIDKIDSFSYSEKYKLFNVYLKEYSESEMIYDTIYLTTEEEVARACNVSMDKIEASMAMFGE